MATGGNGNDGVCGAAVGAVAAAGGVAGRGTGAGLRATGKLQRAGADDTGAGRVEPRKALFAARDTIIINAGTSQGIRAGQHFYVRRLVSDLLAVPAGDARPFSIHTAGWLTIREAQADSSIAIVIEACDGISSETTSSRSCCRPRPSDHHRRT